MIIYECSKCGGLIETSDLLVYPPKYQYKCTKCGATKIFSYREGVTRKIVDMEKRKNE